MDLIPNFEGVTAATKPYPHFVVPQLFDGASAERLAGLVSAHPDWSLVHADFYEQFETSAYDLPETAALRALLRGDIVGAIADQMRLRFGCSRLTLADVTLHRLAPGHSVRLHNDYVRGEETHRLIVHLTRRWEESHGGYFVIFDDSRPESVASLVRPVLNSAIAFEISERSHHAVSKVFHSDRYSAVFSFSSA